VGRPVAQPVRRVGGIEARDRGQHQRPSISGGSAWCQRQCDGDRPIKDGVVTSAPSFAPTSFHRSRVAAHVSPARTSAGTPAIADECPRVLHDRGSRGNAQPFCRTLLWSFERTITSARGFFFTICPGLD
jgi:hypothetical protein